MSNKTKPATAVKPPKAQIPVHKSQAQRQAEEAIAAVESAPPIKFSTGEQIRIGDLTGIDTRRIRVATEGYITDTQSLFRKIQMSDLEAWGALYWVARLKDAGIGPEDASFTFEDCCQELDFAAVVALTALMVEDDAPDPT
jgi:hypothetical protein